MRGEQLSLQLEGGRGQRPQKPFNRQRDNTFLAYQPAQPLAERIAGLASEIKVGYGLLESLRPQSTLHMTLLSLGYHRSIPAELAEKIGFILSSAQFDPIDIVFDTVMNFGRGGKCPIVLCSRERNSTLYAEQKRLAKILGLAPQRFTPHMTIIWTDTRITEQHLDVPIRWSVDVPHLIYSLVGQSKHHILWPSTS